MKKSRIFDRYDRVVAHDSKYTGEEPSWDDSKSLDGVAYHRRRSTALSFYNYYCTTKDLVNDVAKFAKSQGYKSDIIRAVKSNHKYFSFTASKLARMLNKGMPSTHEGWKEYCAQYEGVNMTEANNDIQFVKNEIDRISKQYAEVKAETEEANEPKLSVVDRMNNKVNDKVIYHLDTMLDEWSSSETKVEGLNLLTLFKSNDIPVRALGVVENWLEKLRTSLQNCIDKDNEFDIEGWSFLYKPAIKNRIKEIDKMSSQIEKYRGANTKVRKPRKKKVKTANMQVKKLQYKESDDDYGVSSVSPLTVPGSRKVIVFNTKTRKLSVYESDSEIEVKGTSLKNFDEIKSYGLTIRKPDDILPIIANKTEKMFTKAIDTLKTKRGKVNGRINKDTILLRTL